jgi:hypothetical protein
MPWNDQALDQVDGDEEQNPDHRQQEEGGEHERQIEVAVRDLQHIADARVRAHELADHGAHHRERHRDLEPAEDARQRVGKADLEEDLEPRRLHRLGEIDHFRLDRFEAHHGRHHHREEAEQERRDHLGNDPEAEPHHEERRDRDLGHALGEHQDRIEHALHQPRIGDRDRHRNAEGDREREAPDGRIGGDQALPPQLGPLREELDHDRARRRNEIGRNVEGADRDLP